MKFVKLSVFALLLLSVACTNDLNDSGRNLSVMNCLLQKQNKES